MSPAAARLAPAVRAERPRRRRRDRAITDPARPRAGIAAFMAGAKMDAPRISNYNATAS